MRCFIFMFMIFCSHLAIAYAEGLFQYERIDFFKGIDTQRKPSQTVSKENLDTIMDEWAEPIISPSGKVSIYVPPKEVKDFLEKPDPQNAKAYLEWNLKRIKKFILAQQLLAKEARELDQMEENKGLANINSAPNPLTGNSTVRGSYLFYFMLKGCSACQRETQVIEDLYLNHPEIKIEAFAKGFSDRELQEFTFPARQDKGMSKLFKVNSYPAIAVFNSKKRKYFLSGYIDKERILRLLE